MSQRVDAADGRFLGVVVFSLAPGQLTTLHKSIDLGAARQAGRWSAPTDQIIRARFGTGNENGDVGAGEWVPPRAASRSMTTRRSDPSSGRASSIT